MSASKDWIHVTRVNDTIHSADNNTAGQHTLTNYPTRLCGRKATLNQTNKPHSSVFSRITGQVGAML